MSIKVKIQRIIKLNDLDNKPEIDQFLESKLKLDNESEFIDEIRISVLEEKSNVLADTLDQFCESDDHNEITNHTLSEVVEHLMDANPQDSLEYRIGQTLEAYLETNDYLDNDVTIYFDYQYA